MMKEQSRPVRTAVLALLVGILFMDRSVGSVSASKVDGIWHLEADIVVSYPSQYTCSFLGRIGDPSIPVTQSGDQIYASDYDPSPMPFTLHGTIDGNSVVFTITGFGITPGDGGCSLASMNFSTTYSGMFDANTNMIQGNVSGSADYSFERDGQGNLMWRSVTWTGAFTVTIKGVPVLLVHGYSFTPTTPGTYSASIQASGIQADAPFNRTAVWVIDVSDLWKLYLPLVDR